MLICFNLCIFIIDQQPKRQKTLISCHSGATMALIVKLSVLFPEHVVLYTTLCDNVCE